MNLDLLHTKHQEFINRHLNSNITSLLLKGTANTSIPTTVLVEQIEAKKKCEKKLPSWFGTQNIYYPNKLNIEQTSSEITARYKASLIAGEALIDLTAGFGVDCYYFSKRFKQVIHCEINTKLAQIVAHNYKQLNTNNITCINKNGVAYLNENAATFDYIYIDPSRRNEIKGKVFLLNDCLPNVPEHLELLFKRSKHIMIKTSPLLDFSIGINELKHVKTIHSVAVNNEVKELLWILERNYEGEIAIKTINISQPNQQVFNFDLVDEALATVQYSAPSSYLYEPNAAVLKAGAFNCIGQKLNLKKLHQHSHLYTSDTLIDFPGRCFKIQKTIAYNKKLFKKEINSSKANVTTRNFPESVQNIRKKLSIKDGGETYLFFTTNNENKKIIISCTKAG